MNDKDSKEKDAMEYLNGKIEKYMRYQENHSYLKRYRYIEFLRYDFKILIEEVDFTENIDRYYYPNIMKIVTSTDFMVYLGYGINYLNEVLEDELGVSYTELKKQEEIINTADLR